MPATYVTPGGDFCADFDANASLLDTCLTDVSVVTNGQLLLTYASGATANSATPEWPDKVNSGLILSFQAIPNANLLDYTAGSYQVNAVVHTVAAPGTLSVNAGDPVNRRSDAIFGDNAGNIVYIAGVAGVNPIPPATPAGYLRIAEIGVDPLASAATGGYNLSLANFSSSGLFGGTADDQTTYWNQAIQRWLPNSNLKSDGTNTAVGAATVASGANDEQLQLDCRVQIFDSGAPAVTTDKLYNDSGNLFWDGQQLNGPGVVPAGTVVDSILKWSGASWTEDTISLVKTSGTASFSIATTALANNFNTFIGRNIATTGLTTGDSNTAVGANSLTDLTSGMRNTAVGNNAGANLTNATDSVAVGYNSMSAAITAVDSTAVGTNAMPNNPSPNLCTAVGSRALNSQTSGVNNTAVGAYAGQGLVTGARNVFLGAGASSAAATSDSIVIGNVAQATASNQFVLGSPTSKIDSMHLGQGPSASTPNNLKMSVSKVSGGADAAGAKLTIASGASKGAFAGGDIELQVSPVGPAATENAHSTRAILSYDSFETLGGRVIDVSTVQTTGFTASADAHLYRLDSSGGSFTATLPTTGLKPGQVFVFKDTTGSCAANPVLIDPTGAVTVDGAASVTLSANYSSVTVCYDGTNYMII